MFMQFTYVNVGAAVGPIRGQDPEIVDDILPEVQRVGGTARLNCTVANKQTNNVGIFLPVSLPDPVYDLCISISVYMSLYSCFGVSVCPCIAVPVS